MTILCYPNFTCHCTYNARPKGFAVERQKSFSYKDPLFAGLFLPHALRLYTQSYSWIGVDLFFYTRSGVIFGCRSWWLCLAPTQIGTQRFTQPLCLDPLFVLCIFCQCHSPARAIALPARCQMASQRASRLTLSPSLRIGPHLRYCCCSSVVERVIGNDEVGSSILPSSTRIFCPVFDYFLRAIIPAQLRLFDIAYFTADLARH